jgi:DNA-binding transcriptional MocR family regulator
LVEEPTYFLSLEIFRDHGLQVYSIDMDEDGVRIDQLREAAARYNPKFFYTIPVHQNPTGMTMSLERRHQVVELSSEYDFAIIADEVYHLLSYGDIPPPSFASFIGDHGIHAAGIDTGGIYALGSFSKILAPGLRLGWIECSQSRIKPIITYGQLNSGGALNPFVSGVITSMLELGLQDTHLSRLRETYAKRMQTMRGALHKHLPDSVHLNNPNGGYFFWLTCPESIDISRLDAAVKEKGTKFIAGPRFSPRGIQEHQIRLSFSYHDEAQIEEGVRRLGEAFSNL